MFTCFTHIDTCVWISIYLETRWDGWNSCHSFLWFVETCSLELIFISSIRLISIHFFILLQQSTINLMTKKTRIIHRDLHSPYSHVVSLWDYLYRTILLPHWDNNALLHLTSSWHWKRAISKQATCWSTES